MDNTSQLRLEYVDLCKVFAMFLVTMAHCAQKLSGNLFPEMILSKDLFISFNMPLFMIASGFVMNLSKIRATPVVDFITAKFVRLIVPMTTWFIVLYIVMYPRYVCYWDAYWFLSAMFICFVTIKILSKLIIFDVPLCFTSIIVLTIIPFTFLERSCFMIPYLFTGYYLRRFISQINIVVVVFLFLVYCLMYYFWDVRYSIYNSPFFICSITLDSLFSLVFRFLIGAIGGIALIGLMRIIVERVNGKWIKKVAKYGQYTLVFYTMSFVLNALLDRLVWRIGYVTRPEVLDLVAGGVSLLMMMLMYFFQKGIENNKILCLLTGVSYQYN